MRAMPSSGMKFFGSPFSKIWLAFRRKILPRCSLGLALFRKRTMPGAVALFCLAATLTWLAFASQRADGQGGGIVFGLLWCLLALVLVVLGSEQVATSVSVARETGILDFHRISPLPPAKVALGFFLGAPIREACYAALLVPFLAATAILAGIPWTSLVDLVAIVVFVTLLVYAWQLLAALVSRLPRASSRGILLLVFLSLGFGASAIRDGSFAAIVGGLDGYNQFEVVKWPAGITPATAGLGTDCIGVDCTVLGGTARTRPQEPASAPSTGGSGGRTRAYTDTRGADADNDAATAVRGDGIVARWR